MEKPREIKLTADVAPKQTRQTTFYISFEEAPLIWM
jgi:hypothetical protein